jgi:hypothetical protein
LATFWLGVKPHPLLLVFGLMLLLKHAPRGPQKDRELDLEVGQKMAFQKRYEISV